MSGARRNCRILQAAAFAAALSGAGACFAPPVAAAPPSSNLIEHVAGSRLFENGAGFTWGTSGGSFVMARTTDNGRTWSRLDLSGLQVDLGALAAAPDAGTSTVFVHFADPTHGWVVWATKHSNLHVASTSDGGRSWREALTVPTDAVQEEELIPGPGRACLLAEMPEGMMHTTMVTVCTDDDGVSWTASTLPYGDGVTGWTFRTPTDGFISVRYPPGVQILLYRTQDGGKSWQGVDMPLPPGLTPDDVDGTFPGVPSFSGPGRLDGEMKVGLYLQNGMVSFAYRTTDGGMTWHGTKAEK